MRIQQDTPEELNAWINYLYGRENDPVHGPCARFAQANVKTRPATGQPRWANFDALRNINAYHRYVLPDDLEASIAAFRADAG